MLGSQNTVETTLILPTVILTMHNLKTVKSVIALTLFLAGPDCLREVE